MTLARLRRILQQRTHSLLASDAADFALSSELSFHLDQLVAENIAEGMEPRVALAAARKALGNPAVIEEACRDQRRLGWFHDFRQDLRYGCHMLRASPVFTATAIFSLALGIGGNTAILSVAHSVFNGPFPFREPERLVIAREFRVDAPNQTASARFADFLAWSAGSRSFASLGASLVDNQDFDAEERLEGQKFTAGLFDTLGVAPALGRFFTDRDQHSMLISDRLWKRRYGGDPRILKRSVRLGDQPTRIVGVMPPDFHYVVDTADYWIPLRIDPAQTPVTARFYIVAGRLKAGITLQQAQAEMQSLLQDSDKDWRVRLLPIRDAMLGWTVRSLSTMEIAVVLVLLLACANVSLLLLARASARAREMMLRRALGAGPGRIVRQLLTESMLLSLSGGAAGLLVAAAGLRSITLLQPPPGATHLAAIPLDLTVFLIALLTSLAAGAAFGYAPAFAGTRTFNLVHPPASSRIRSTLVSTQIAVAFILLAGAGLLMKSAWLLATREFNFNTKGLVTFEYRLPQREQAHAVESNARVLARLKSLAGATAVAGISHRPVNSLIVPRTIVRTDGREPVSAAYFLVTPGYFHTIEARLIAGRDVGEEDTAGAPWVAVINETMARRCWPGADPLGKLIVSDEGSRRVAGVIRDIPIRSEDPRQEAVVYASFLQQPANPPPQLWGTIRQMTFVLRGAGDPMALIPAARQAVWRADPAHPIARIATVRQMIYGRMLELDSYVLVLLVLALAATLLAATGVYGVTAFAVARRKREIGIRVALGASRWQVFALAGRWAATAAAAGIAAGSAGALALAPSIAPQLWNVAPWDVTVLASVTGVVTCVVFLACFKPARRALVVDPSAVLRVE